MDGKTLKFVTEEMNMGVNVSEDVKWEKQSNYVVGEANKM